VDVSDNTFERKGSAMIRRFLSTAITAGAVAALTVAAAAPSYADRPGPKMPGDHSDLPLTFDTGTVCPFQVTISLEAAHDWSREEASGVVRGSGRLVLRFTNDDTKASVVRNVSGPGSFTFDPAGNLTAIDVSGVSLGWQTEGSDLTGTIGTALYVSHGPFHYNGDLQLVSYSGTYENICNVLE
jgi:hypothetical protein